MKPFDKARLADTVERLRARLARTPEPAADSLDAVIEKMSAELPRRVGASAWLP